MRTWVLGEFADKHALIEAVKKLREEGFRRIDTYTPYPVEEVSELLELPPSGVRWFGLFGGLFGAGFGYFTQWYCNAFDFPIVVGGRPFHSLPSFIPITFESAVLFSALSIFFAALANFGFPRIDHPLFEVSAFETASIDKFWVSVTTDKGAEAVERTKARLEALGAKQTSTVEEKTE